MDSIKTIFLFFASIDKLKSVYITNIPIDDPISAYFERMETLGYLAKIPDGIRLYNRTMTPELLNLIDMRKK